MTSFNTTYGHFIETDDDRRADAVLNRLLYKLEPGATADKAMLAQLRALTVKHPRFVDGHAHLALALQDHGKSIEAIAAAEKGIEIGRSLLPPKYTRKILWDSLENRPFLRAVHAAILAYIATGQRAKSIALLKRALKWNPSDNQGFRLIIGSELLRAGDKAGALKWLEKYANDYPPYQYELALLHFSDDNYADAVACLRRGFLENLYIAEMLTGTDDPIPLAMAHFSNLGDPSTAKEYLPSCAALWKATPLAIAFVRWLNMHPMVLRERATAIELRQAVDFEDDVSKRIPIIDGIRALRSAITADQSKAMIKPIAEINGLPIYPWMANNQQVIRLINDHQRRMAR